MLILTYTVHTTVKDEIPPMDSSQKSICFYADMPYCTQYQSYPTYIP